MFQDWISFEREKRGDAEGKEMKGARGETIDEVGERGVRTSRARNQVMIM